MKFMYIAIILSLPIYFIMSYMYIYINKHMSFYVQYVNSDYEIDFSYDVYLIDASAGSIVLTLDDPQADGFKCYIKRLDTNAANGLVVNSVTTTIDGQPSVTMSVGSNILLTSLAGLWYTVSGSAQHTFPGMIPFSSGSPVALADNGSGSVGIPVFVAFGNSTPGVANLSSPIDLTGGTGGVAANMAFSAPRNGTAVTLNAFFNVTTAPALLSDGSYIITAELYTNNGAPTPTQFIELSPAVSVVLPTISSSLSLIPVGANVSGSTSVLMNPINMGDRLLLVISVTATGGAQGVTLNGFISGGLTLA